MILAKSARVRVQRRKNACPPALAVIALFASACSGATEHGNIVKAPAHGIVVACTISTLCSLVAAVGGDEIELRGIVPVGASPETYEPRPSDVVAVSQARVLFENGAGLEAWLDKLLRSASSPDLTRVVLSDAIPAAEKVSGNPHLWMDPVYAQAYVRSIEAALRAGDPAHERAYAANAAAEEHKLAALDRWIRAQIGTIPPQSRSMIAFHDAWYYFDRRYGIENVGAIEPLPGQDPSPGYFAHLIALAKAHHVRAVFGEPQYSPKLATALQAGAGIKVFSNLYDDTLGTGGIATDYVAMMRYDVTTIVQALRG